MRNIKEKINEALNFKMLLSIRLNNEHKAKNIGSVVFGFALIWMYKHKI